MNRQLTLGSLFDGSGGFPLGAVLNGIIPVWASEIEPFPIRVTTKRFPQMKHYGDICSISGAEIEPVDIISFGSPCTDMSIAGKRAGLKGSQSNLFFQAIRIIKEMRCATNGGSPRFILWENVPGAFSSNKGADFKAVLESIVQIVEPNAEMPTPEKSKWSYADVLLGDGWSIAYRTIDAQYFGVAQRRKRIYLVADIGSERAGEILFEFEGMSRNFTTCPDEGQASARNLEGSFGTTSSFKQGIVSYVDGHLCREYAGAIQTDAVDSHISAAIECYHTDGRVKFNEQGKVQTLTSHMGTGGNNVPLTLEIVSNPSTCIAGNIIDRAEKNGGNGSGFNDNLSFNLNTADRHAVAYSMPDIPNMDVQCEKSATLSARDYKSPPLVSFGLGSAPRYIVRRITPMECARLQGFPDWWCEGLEISEPSEEEIDWWAEVFETYRKVTGSLSRPKSRRQIVKWLQNPRNDMAEYKMWGNGVALPCVCFVLNGLVSLVHNQSLQRESSHD